MTILKTGACPHCGGLPQPGDAYCPDCGTRLDGQPPPLPQRRPSSGPPMREHDPDRATRYLCSAVHLNEAMARTVAATVLDEPYRAIHPNHGIGMVALVRHAASARNTARLRTGIAVLIGFVIPLILLLAACGSLFGGSGSSDYFSEDPGGSFGAGVLFFSYVFIAIPVLLFLLRVVYRLYCMAQAVAVMNQHVDPADLASSVDRMIEKRLESVDSGNTIVFSGPFSGANPFVGSGAHLGTWVVTLDTSKAGIQDGSSQIIPFDEADLHDWLARTVPDLTLAGLVVREKLYVSGVDAPLVQGLVPGTGKPPYTHMPEGILTNVLRNPTSYARTYLVFERLTAGNQLGLTYLVRADLLQNNTLFIEGVSVAMPPLGAPCLAVTTVPMEHWDRFVTAVKQTFKQNFRPSFTLRGWRSLATRRDRIRPGVVIDYGARRSVRAEVAADLKDYYYADVDQRLYLETLQRRVLENIVEFLRRHNVDTSEFERHSEQVINNIHNGNIFNVNEVSGQGNVFGDQAQVTNAQQGG
ncbi:zinc ribbon domain-containing protein [Protofrankia coriariae]|nr:zinc ribbon domain-containing protein [Protofrankia coriariae]